MKNNKIDTILSSVGINFVLIVVTNGYTYNQLLHLLSSDASIHIKVCWIIKLMLFFLFTCFYSVNTMNFYVWHQENTLKIKKNPPDIS